VEAIETDDSIPSLSRCNYGLTASNDRDDGLEEHKTVDHHRDGDRANPTPVADLEGGDGYVTRHPGEDLFPHATLWRIKGWRADEPTIRDGFGF